MNKILIISVLALLSLSANAQTDIAYDRSYPSQLLQNQDFEKAVAYLLPLNKPNMPLQYHLDLGYSYYMLDQLTESLAAYLKSFQKDSSNIQANLYLAAIYSRQRLPELALAHYKRLTVLYPDVYRYWQNAAKVAETLREFDSAYAYIEKSYALRPQSASVVFQYVEALQRKKMPEAAEAAVNSYIKNDSTNELILSKKIDISFNQNKNNEVIFWGERLWQNNAQTSGAFTRLMFSYLNTGLPDKCIQLFDWMDLQNMSNESVQYGAALAYARKKDFAKSNELLDKCIKNNIIKEAALYLRAKADNYEGMKDYAKAVAYYDTSYYIFHAPLDLYYAGAVYDNNLKNKPKATSYYKRYLQRSGKPQSKPEQQIGEYVRRYLEGEGKK